MDARAKSVKEILHSGDQYLVPFFQRHYSWKRKNWDRLWADVSALLDDDDQKAQHFLGPLVCTPTDHVPGEVTPYQLIDGQQRLTTLSVFLAAVADAARGRGLIELADEITEDYLIHKRRKGFQRFKLVPRTGDREVLQGVIDGKVEKQFRRDGIVQAWKLFRKRIEIYLGAAEESEKALRRLLSTVADRLSLVVITITGENPYEIFESLNSTGLLLEQSDLIRNYLFMQVPLAQQDEFSQEHWQEFERLFEAEGEYPSISQTSFYRNFVMRRGGYSKRHEIFVDFKRQSKSDGAPPAALVADLSKYARFEQLLRRPGSCPDEPLRRAIQAIEALDIATAHPLIMRLLAAHQDGICGSPELLGCLTDLQSFVLRRSICGETTRPYSRWFVAAIKDVAKSPRADLQKFWLSKGWPDDKTLLHHLTTFPAYRREKAKVRLILESVEMAAGHKEAASLAKATIEHVLPQTISDDTSGRAWKEMLGKDWSEVHSRVLHTLGNLTLSAYNGNLSKHPFGRKKEILADSKIGLNEYFDRKSVWDEAAILLRTKHLGEAVVRSWPRPTGGPAYTAPAAVGDAGEATLSKKELCSQYWAAASERWKGNVGTMKMAKVRGWTWLGFTVGVKHFNYYAWIHPKQRWIAVGFSTTGRNNKDNFRRLKGRMAQIHSTLGAPLIWEEDPGDSWTSVNLFKRDTDPKQDGDWDKQHDWLLKHLLSLEEAVRPHLSLLQDNGDDDESARV